MTSVYPVHPVECGGLFDYWAGLNSVWGTGRTVVNVEHDMEFSDELVAELLSCPHDTCAYPYLVRPGGWSQKSYSASFVGWTVKDIPYANFSAIGFCKITAAAQDTPLMKSVWGDLEHSVHAAAMRGRRMWHMHWPTILHRHDYESEGDPEEGSLLNLIRRAKAEGRVVMYGDEPTEERLKACDPFLYDQSVRDRIPVL